MLNSTPPSTVCVKGGFIGWNEIITHTDEGYEPMIRKRGEEIEFESNGVEEDTVRVSEDAIRRVKDGTNSTVMNQILFVNILLVTVPLNSCLMFPRIGMS